MQIRTRAVVTALLLSAMPGSAATAQTATWFIATYTNDLLVWDEATEEVIDRVTMRNPIPTRFEMNSSKTRLYVQDASAENIEVVDMAARRVIDEFTLSHDSVWVRINGYAIHPSDQQAVLFVKRYTKLTDRYHVEGPFILEYDLRTKQVTDTIPWPDGESRDDVGFEYAPDGQTLYFFTNDIIAVDANTYEEVDRWEISQPLEPGLGRPSFGTASGTYDEPGVATSIYRMRDPAQNRNMMGIARVRLSEKEVDFFTLGPSEPVGRFALAPGGQRAYALYSTVGRYEFWEFDLNSRRVVRKQEFAGRPRMGLQVSADGRKLYVHVAGNTIDVYDAATFEFMRSVEFDEDMTVGSIAVIPGEGLDP